MAHDAGLGGDVEVHLAARADDELRRAAADVDHEQRRGVAAVAGGGRAEVGEPRLLVAARSCARRGRSASRTVAVNSAPLAASRTAEVSTATRRSQPWRSIASA